MLFDDRINIDPTEEAYNSWVHEHCGHEDRRYIGISGIGGCLKKMYATYMYGHHFPDRDNAFRAKLGIEREAAIIERLCQMGQWSEGPWGSSSDGIFQWHTDGLLNTVELSTGQVLHDVLLEIKTVDVEEHFPKSGRISRKWYYQIQGYMHFTGHKMCVVLVEARANGKTQFYPVPYNRKTAAKIMEIVATLRRAISRETPPVCDCPECGGR